MRELTSRALEIVAAHISKHRSWYIFCVILVTIGLIYPLTGIRFNSDMDTFAPGEPEMEAKDYIENNFDNERSIISIAVPTSGNIRDTGAIADMADVGERVRREIDDVLVFSLANYVMESLCALNRTLENCSAHTLDLIINAAFMDGNVSNTFNQGSAMIVVSLLNASDDEEEIGLKLRKIMGDTENVRIYVLAGFDHDLSQGAMRSLYLFPVSLFLIAAVLFLSLRRWFDVLLTMCAIPVVLIWTFGISVLLGLKLTILGSAVPFIVLALGIDYGIHSMNRCALERDAGRTGKESARRTVKHLGVALLLSSITTVAAYLSNAASSIPAVVDFGIMVAIGIACSFFMMGLMLPVVRSLFGGERKEKKRRDPLGVLWKGLSRIMGRTFSVKRNSVLLIAVTILLTAFFGLGALGLERSFEPDDVLPEDSPWLEAERMIGTYFPSKLEPYQILVRGDIASPEVLAALWNVTVSNGGEDSLIYHMTNWSSLDGEGIRDSFDKLFSEDPMIRQVLHRTGDDYDATVIRIRTDDRDAIDLSALHNLEGVDHILTGQSITHDIVISGLSSSMLRSLVISIIVCVVVVSLVFVSPRVGIITLLPVSIMTVWLLGTMKSLGFSLNVVTIIIVVTSIGVGIDYSIHITNSYLAEREKKVPRELALANSLETSGLSLVGAALTTSLGFFVLAFAPMKGFYAFGILTPIMILYSLFGAIIILPSMLLLSDHLPYLKDVFIRGKK